jgi:hypothetical protein
VSLNKMLKCRLTLQMCYGRIGKQNVKRKDTIESPN